MTTRETTRSAAHGIPPPQARNNTLPSATWIQLPPTLLQSPPSRRGMHTFSMPLAAQQVGVGHRQAMISANTPELYRPHSSSLLPLFARVHSKAFTIDPNLKFSPLSFAPVLPSWMHMFLFSYLSEQGVTMIPRPSVGGVTFAPPPLPSNMPPPPLCSI